MPGKLARLFSALIIALSLSGGGAAVAGPNDPGRTPLQDQAPPEKHDCVLHNSDFTPNATFVIELTNTCEQRYRCTLRAYITNAAGPTRDEVVLMLEPASSGPGARQVHIIKLKESYGEAQSSQSCEAL
jgi:hypothetical protein